MATVAAVGEPGKDVKLTHYWKVVTPPGEGWKVFTHLEGPNHQNFINADHPPVKGKYPVSQWKAGEIMKMLDQPKNAVNSAAYTFGYNRPLFAERVHDILTAISYFRGDDKPWGVVDIVGLNGAGHWVAAACGHRYSSL
jgi:hypothetical protein